MIVSSQTLHMGMVMSEVAALSTSEVITACEKGGLWDLALWILFAMPSKFKVPSC